jgi:O-antigen/teichoic acid export membrane protein
MQQQQPLTLRRNFSWTFVGNLVYAGSQWGMLVVLAKLGSPEMVGQFTLGLAVTAPVVMFTNLQLRSVQATDVRHQYVFSEYLRLRLIMTGLALLIIAGIAFTAGYPWETKLVILAVGAAKAIESISDVLYGLFQQHQRMDSIAKSMMIKGPLSLVTLGLGIYLTGNVIWGAVGLILTWALILLSYDFCSGALILNASTKVLKSWVFGEVSLEKAIQPRLPINKLIKLAWLTLPLGLEGMFKSLYVNVPRYFLEHYWDEASLGYFSSVAYIMVVGNMVVLALGQSAMPRLAESCLVKDVGVVKRLVLNLIQAGAVVGVAGVLVALLFGRRLLTLMYRPDYAEHLDVFVWLMVAQGTSCIAAPLWYVLMSAQFYRVLTGFAIALIGIISINCLWLIPTYGLIGAAWAICVANFIQFLGFTGFYIYFIRRMELIIQEK